MNLSAVGQKLITGLKNNHKLYAKEYLAELNQSVSFLNKVKRDADRCKFKHLTKGFYDDICVNSDVFDLFGTKFTIQLVFSEGERVPSSAIIQEAK
jgi:hypothetical protein